MLRKVGLSLVAAFALAACALNPISQAQTVEQKALAAYGSLTIGVEQIAALVQPRTLPANVQSCLIAVGQKAGAAAKTGLAAYNEAQAARAQFVVDAATQGRFTTAVNSLDGWITSAGPLLDQLPSPTKARGGC